MILSKKIENAIIAGSTSYPKDRLAIFKKFLANEEEENAIWALKLMIKNVEIANMNKLPLCDDTGIPHVFIELAKDRNISSEFFEEIKSGIANGFKNLPGRAMAVKGNDLERIEQSQGLYNKGEMVNSPSFLVDKYDGDKIKIHLLLLGGGPEIRAKTYRVFHKKSYEEVLNQVINRFKKSLPFLGCTPSIPVVGIGRTHFEANELILKAMVFGNLNIQSGIENYLVDELNKTNIGPMGLGGKTTAIGSFINIGPQRTSGVRIVATRPCCFVEPRVATVEI
ncbi:MAG: fumarate hydratase [Methanobacteriaceae archaeon]|jgi:fumarate hydratase subunit alpha|nr:fumarate hydratase [Candidatus Methanorudis spinitermitis]